MRTQFWSFSFFVIAAALLSFSASKAVGQPTTTPTPEMQPTSTMTGMSAMGEMTMGFATDAFAPLVKGIYEGEDVFFVHTEASDSEVAGVLTDMMGPQVVTVASLAEIPDELLGNVYVFTNGIAGSGPMGFQPDVFDSVPGDPDYTPLRALNLVAWQEDTTPRQLDSVAEIMAAEASGEINIQRPGVVINMPILVWPGGQR